MEERFHAEYNGFGLLCNAEKRAVSFRRRASVIAGPDPAIYPRTAGWTRRDKSALMRVFDVRSEVRTRRGNRHQGETMISHNYTLKLIASAAIALSTCCAQVQAADGDACRSLVPAAMGGPLL